jgi:ribonuclease HI
VTKGVRKAGKTLKDAERRRLARRSRQAESAAAEPPAPPPGWAVAWCDGGSRGNPGQAAYAYVIEDADGTVLASAAEKLGIATAATAEYRAVAAALEAAVQLGLDRVEVRTDSRLVAEQLGATRGAVRNPALARLRDRALEAGARIGSVRYRWVPADANGRAHAMVAATRVSGRQDRE